MVWPPAQVRVRSTSSVRPRVFTVISSRTLRRICLRSASVVVAAALRRGLEARVDVWSSFTIGVYAGDVAVLGVNLDAESRHYVALGRLCMIRWGR